MVLYYIHFCNSTTSVPDCGELTSDVWIVFWCVNSLLMLRLKALKMHKLFYFLCLHPTFVWARISKNCINIFIFPFPYIGTSPWIPITLSQSQDGNFRAGVSQKPALKPPPAPSFSLFQEYPSFTSFTPCCHVPTWLTLLWMICPLLLNVVLSCWCCRQADRRNTDPWRVSDGHLPAEAQYGGYCQASWVLALPAGTKVARQPPLQEYSSIWGYNLCHVFLCFYYILANNLFRYVKLYFKSSTNSSLWNSSLTLTRKCDTLFVVYIIIMVLFCLI